ncbi:MAG: Rossman fold protein, TIGR00730 family [Candidatus Taylorbacteria bacterium RIFCSPHIGHO2_02_FULL_46_13]|uniref:Cytokinin riboside 5'-monophosphate phosphoribohydrolase n=1 Tax=Candidatus Taylorbacteria bacterium RIFCSPHIGHO2_02_FULL_46_13 TaxID=1802312 RepID=A0A1G2MUC5_9BACT|nr:MAG: Rossman fold protein, TIGR00730 family [Candidatus Taylorbacteria bacterium RIFCSPHIGHO2_02_FULL_46_13]
MINKEFSEGLEFIRKYPKSVTIFGSAILPETNTHYQQARELGAEIARHGYTVVTGGGPGIMEAANRGALEAGGKSVGLNITLPHEQKQNPYLTDFYQFYYFFSRKVALTYAAEAYVFFPGGYGTLNEFFEIVTLVQTQRITPAPATIILVGSDFWKPLDDFIRQHLYKQHGMVDEEALSLYTICDEKKAIMDTILKVPVISSVPFEKK